MKKVLNLVLFILLVGSQAFGSGFSTYGNPPQTNQAGSVIELSSGINLPPTCEVGDTYIDTDADTDGSLYICAVANTWKEVDDDGNEVPDDILFCWGDQNDFCFTYDELVSNTLKLLTNNPIDMILNMVNSGVGNFIAKINGHKVLTEEHTVAVDGRGIVNVLGTDIPVLGYGTQVYTKATSGTLSVLECSNGIVNVTGASTQTLPPVFAGADVWIYTKGNIEVNVAPNLVDKLFRKGVALHDDDQLRNTSTSGDWLHLIAHGSDGWWANYDFSVPWTDEGLASGAPDHTSGADCMGAWRMNSSGNETDISGEGGTLLETGGDIPTGASVPVGWAGTGRDFELADTEYLSHADGLSTDISGANQPITICGNINAESNAQDMVIAQKWDYSTDDRQYRFRTNTGDGVLYVTLSSGGDAVSATAFGITDVTDGGDYKVCFVYDDTDIRIYVNGVLDANGADNPKVYTDGIYDGAAPFIIGNSLDGNDWEFDGLIDQLNVYNSAKSAADVLEIATEGMEGCQGCND